MKPKAPSQNKAAYRLLVEYDGGRYQGWQRQGDAQTAQGIRTVTGTLERALKEAGLNVMALGGSGRTDAGVHALGQVAHLHLSKNNAPSVRDLQRLFDQGLPSDIAVAEIRTCDLSFHARHNARSRTYLYQISLRRTALGKPYVWWVKGRFDVRVLEDVWHAFEGPQDVSAFSDLEPDEDPRCRILRCECSRKGSLLLLRTTADHFLRRQVRRMVGASVACAQGKARLEEVLADLKHPNREANLRWSPLAAPASGLFLESVQYEEEPLPGPITPVVLVR